MEQDSFIYVKMRDEIRDFSRHTYLKERQSPRNASCEVEKSASRAEKNRKKGKMRKKNEKNCNRDLLSCENGVK